MLLEPRLARFEAAAYVGICARTFDAMVADVRMPSPRKIDTRRVWDIRDLNRAFDALPYLGMAPPADDVWGQVA